MVLRLLYVDSPQTIESLDKWARIEGTAKHKIALDELFRLRILIDPGSERCGSTQSSRFYLFCTRNRQRGGTWILPR